MKTILSTLFLLLSSLLTYAVDIKRDSVVMGMDYQNDIYYSFDQAISRTSANNFNYHLALSNMVSQDDRFYTIWLNPNTAKAFVNPNQKSVDWSQFNATGSENWRELLNTDTSWGKGAFSHGVEKHPRYTWAEYKGNGDLRGDSLYLLKIYNTVTEDFDISMKLKLTQRLSTNGIRTWKFQLGKIDNSWDTMITLNDLEKSKGNFMYFNVLSKKEIVREPKTADWDFTFTRYQTFTQGLHYTVTGLLSNYGISSSQINGNITDPNISGKLSALKYDTLINSVGFEWKSFDQVTFKYKLEEDIVRIVKKDLGNGMADYYAIQFVRFDGRTTGKIVFDYAYLGQFSNVKTSKVETLNFYPNPSNGNIQFKTNSKIEQAMVYDLTGKLVHSVINPGTTLDLSFLQSGNYIIYAALKNGNAVQSKMIKL